MVHSIGTKNIPFPIEVYEWGTIKEAFAINDYKFLSNNIDKLSFSSYNKAVYFANIRKYEQSIELFEETIEKHTGEVASLSIFGLAICSYFLGDRKNLLNNINYLKRNFLGIFHPDFYRRGEYPIINLSGIHFEKIREVWINSVEGSIGNLKWCNYV